MHLILDGTPLAAKVLAVVIVVLSIVFIRDIIDKFHVFCTPTHQVMVFKACIGKMTAVMFTPTET